jgi:hypothetical protein
VRSDVDDDDDDNDDEWTRTNIHALSGTRTHNLSLTATNAHASRPAATGPGHSCRLHITLRPMKMLFDVELICFVITFKQTIIHKA